MATTYAVVGLLGQVMFNQNFGVMNQLKSGREATDNQLDRRIRPMAFVMIVFWMSGNGTPFVALVLLAGLTMVPGEVEEAARTGNEKLVDPHPALRPAAVSRPRPCRRADLAHRPIRSSCFDMVFTLTAGWAGKPRPNSSR